MADQQGQQPKNRSAGLFDLRYILALLFIIYGVVVTVMGSFASARDLSRAGGWNLNLWTGVVMIIVALLFAGWARWRPVRVPVPAEPDDASSSTGQEREAGADGG